MTYLENYFKLQFEYESFYKRKVIILQELGSFYETYEYDPDICIDSDLKSIIYNKRIGHTSDICNELKLKPFYRNRQTSHSINNPLMTGFPVVCCEKYINALLEHSYIVIKLEYCKADPSLNYCITEIIQPNH